MRSVMIYDMMNKPVVETVEEECPTECAFDDAEELFTSKVVHV